MKKNQYYLIYGLLICLVIGITGCAKDSASDNIVVNTKEEAIACSISPDPGTTVLSVLGASQDFTINITSKLPSLGVRVLVSVTRELDGGVVFSQDLSTNLSSFNSSIQNLQNGVLCNASFKLVSKSDSTNNLVKTFKLARK